MPVWLRVILVIGGLLLIIVLGTAGGLWWWWTHHGRLAMKHGVEQGMAAMKEGEQFAAQTDQTGCVDEAFARNKTCSSFACQLEHSLFLGGCLAAAKETPGFCEGVPRTHEIMASVKWQMDRCAARDAGGDPGCSQLYKAVQRYCDDPFRSRSASAPAPAPQDSAAQQP